MKLVMLGVFVVVVAVLLIVSQVGRVWAERKYPPHGELLEVAGERLHVRVHGDPSHPALLLVHGASSNLRDLDAVLATTLAEAGYRVLSFDRPGYGHSTRRSGAWMDPGQQVGLMLQAARDLGVDRPVVVGHSWAGAVVMAALVEHPQAVSGGVLISGVAGHWAGPLGASYSIGRLPIIGPLFAHTLLFPLGMLMLDDALAAVAAPDPVPPGYRERIGAVLALRPSTFLRNVDDVDRLNIYLQELSRRYRDINLPLLAIHGEADDIVPYWNHGERLEPVVRTLRVHRMTGVGHAPHQTRTDEVLKVLGMFLDTVFESDDGADRYSDEHSSLSRE